VILPAVANRFHLNMDYSASLIFHISFNLPSADDQFGSLHLLFFSCSGTFHMFLESFEAMPVSQEKPVIFDHQPSKVR